MTTRANGQSLNLAGRLGVIQSWSADTETHPSASNSICTRRAPEVSAQPANPVPRNGPDGSQSPIYSVGLFLIASIPTASFMGQYSRTASVVRGLSVEEIVESIRIRRCAPGVESWAVGRMEIHGAGRGRVRDGGE